MCSEVRFKAVRDERDRVKYYIPSRLFPPDPTAYRWTCAPPSQNDAYARCARGKLMPFTVWPMRALFEGWAAEGGHIKICYHQATHAAMRCLVRP